MTTLFSKDIWDDEEPDYIMLKTRRTYFTHCSTWRFQVNCSCTDGTVPIGLQFQSCMETLHWWYRQRRLAPSADSDKPHICWSKFANLFFIFCLSYICGPGTQLSTINYHTELKQLIPQSSKAHWLIRHSRFLAPF